MKYWALIIDLHILLDFAQDLRNKDQAVQTYELVLDLAMSRAQLMRALGQT